MEVQNREAESHKLIATLKAQASKLEAKLVHSRHEIKKLQLDNDKLRQTLKAKMKMQGSQMLEAAPLVNAIGGQETLADMMQDGFLE